MCNIDDLCRINLLRNSGVVPDLEDVYGELSSSKFDFDAVADRAIRGLLECEL